MQRDIFDAEHDEFRNLVRAFIAREVTPYHEQWEADRRVSREVWPGKRSSAAASGYDRGSMTAERRIGLTLS